MLHRHRVHSLRHQPVLQNDFAQQSTSRTPQRVIMRVSHAYAYEHNNNAPRHHHCTKHAHKHPDKVGSKISTATLNNQFCLKSTLQAFWRRAAEQWSSAILKRNVRHTCPCRAATHLRDGRVRLQAISQSLRSIGTEAVAPDIHLCYTKHFAEQSMKQPAQTHQSISVSAFTCHTHNMHKILRPCGRKRLQTGRQHSAQTPQPLVWQTISA